MLNSDDRIILQHFVDRCAPGDAYLRRARILLLADEGLTPERIAAEVGVTAVQVRNFLRAFQKQGLTLFPVDLFKPSPLFGPQEPLSEAARQIARQQLVEIRLWLPQVIDMADATASATAVHELRKAIRQLRTAMRLFAPYFTPGLLVGYRRKLRKLMILSADSRDLTVFCANLAAFAESYELSADEREGAAELLAHWQGQQAAVNAALQKKAAKPKWEELLAEMEMWAASPGAATRPAPAGKVVPQQTRHLLPVLVYQQLAESRAFDGRLDDAPLTVWHELRIHLKRLRYLLEFFEPLLGATTVELFASLKQMQDLLGELNDARVALERLAGMREDGPGATGATFYRAFQEAKIETLKSDFAPLWRSFNQAAWRQKLAMALLAL